MDQIVGAYKQALTRYADFSGRTSVAGFWGFVGVNIAVSILLQVLAQASSIFWVLGIVYSLAVLIPSIAVGVRRLHDTGRDWYWILLWFLCFIGWIILIVFWVQPSDGPNEHGQGPED